MCALQEWRCYLEGAEATIYTDHQSLHRLMTQQKLNGRQARWLELIWHYQHQIKYKEGVANLADPFSRRPDFLEEANPKPAKSPVRAAKDLNVLEATVELEDLKPDLIAGYAEDPYYSPTAKRHRALRCVNGVWYFRHRIAVPNVMALRQKLLKEAHDVPYAGHQGRERTLAQLVKFFWWPRSPHGCVAMCELAHRAKPTSRGTRVPLACCNPYPCLRTGGSPSVWTSSLACQSLHRARTLLLSLWTA